ncbi:calcineurin-like phosphoesterase family protein [Mumia flava]|uniref:Calcineurin-like phosphoesterase family protein n=1 Tax=Mumia flava TaxID=1348852 RepID=A0A0B2BQB5_9ACTN|nr:metallophosphoesterase [Mumia flava]PJJ58109.1 calcineurin-like phosphoesterase family protein [Mumia flava]
MGGLYAVSDIHGHLEVLVATLHANGLTDADGHWTGGDARLWFLGDYVDRGPDGLAVIELAMRLEDEAAAAGGSATALLGNHEILLLGTQRYGETEIPSDPRFNFAVNWIHNGGVITDLEGLTEEHLDWLTTRDVIASVDGHLLMHSDTTGYLLWADEVDQINAAVRAELHMPDLETWWEAWTRLTHRYAFSGEDGHEVARTMLATLGGNDIVHGHTIGATLRGGGVTAHDEPVRYAGGLVLDIDGGIYLGGPCQLVRLDTQEPPGLVPDGSR